MNTSNCDLSLIGRRTVVDSNCITVFLVQQACDDGRELIALNDVSRQVSGAGNATDAVDIAATTLELFVHVPLNNRF
jgi:hypothetical protein